MGPSLRVACRQRTAFLKMRDAVGAAECLLTVRSAMVGTCEGGGAWKPVQQFGIPETSRPVTILLIVVFTIFLKKYQWRVEI